MDRSDAGVDEAGPATKEGSDAEAAARNERLVESLLAGEHRALARVITRIENRAPGHRDLVSLLHEHTGDTDVVGITGSPGAGKSTLVDKLAAAYRERGDTVGVVAVDPASPYSGGSVLGDRVRMASTVGDMDVFFRSMSARGQLGGLSTATTDAVKALDAFGKDVVVVETVGAGQSEVDVVRTADTVAVVVQPGSGDDVQMLKAGILEIGDVFVVNKADTEGVERTVAELEEMLRGRGGGVGDVVGGVHRPKQSASERPNDASVSADDPSNPDDGLTDADDDLDWEPSIVETVATTGEGVDELLAALDAHADYLRRSGRREERALSRYAEEVRRLVRSDVEDLLESEIERRGGIDALARRIRDRETDPYAAASSIVGPLRECVEENAGGEESAGVDEYADRD